MSRAFIIRARAEADLAEAMLWYENRARGLGAQFIRCVDAALSLIQRHPGAAPLHFQQFRRVLVPRFPFGVFYTVEADAVVVHAVLHLSQDPERIQKLIRNSDEHEHTPD